MEDLHSYIDGDFYSEQGGRIIPNINPATGALISNINVASTNCLDAAVDSAIVGQQLWNQISYKERRDILMSGAESLRSQNLSLAEMEVLDTGKPISESVCDDAIGAAKCIEFFAGLIDKIYGQSIKVDDALIYTKKEPIGVCFGMGAWNYPLLVASWKLAPALATGNSLIYKPSEHSSTSTLKLAQILTNAGLPNGVFNVVLGDGEVGQYLSLHEKVRKVSLTGSVSTGKQVVQNASSTLKNISMELGGKSPLIVFDDANISQAIDAAMVGNFYTQGQVCSNCSRVYLHSNIYDEFIVKLKEKTEKLIIGNPFNTKTQVGSLISQAHMEKVLSYIQSGISEGAEILTGGNRYKKGECSNGAFIEPTIFIKCHDKMRIVREEIFGPVMSILRFNNEADVIERANNSEFGLASGVFSTNLQRAHRVAEKLQSGVCWVNNYNVTPMQMPFGGHKQSGIGFENGLQVIEQYTQNKSIYVQLKDFALTY